MSSFLIRRNKGVLLIMFIALCNAAVNAAIIPTGDVTPTYNGSDPWALNTDLSVGKTGAGSLEIDGASVVNNFRGWIGSNSSSTGTVTVTGIGSTWNNTSELDVGRFGQGTLSITGGGTVNNVVGYIGNWVNSTGSVTVNGTGSTWNNNFGDLFVGHAGAGTLNIEDGGVVEVSNYTRLGEHPTGSGTINFDNGVLNTTGLYASANELLGTGVINTKGLVSDVNLVFDANMGLQQQIVLNNLAGQNVAVNMDISNTSVNYPLGVGYRGAGTLIIADGVVVSSNRSHLGYHAGSQGTATVTGVDSTWNSHDFWVGGEGAGVLNIESGGSVNVSSRLNLEGTSSVNITTGGMLAATNRSYIGNNPGTNGNVTVDGVGSHWSNSSWHIIGYEGTGAINVTNGGTVNSDGLTWLGERLGSNGTATVSGAGSVWNVDATLYIGSLGTGTLNIHDGGVVSNADSYLGYVNITSGTGIGTATVAGAGSAWNTDALYVGRSGSGTLSVEDGGTVNSSGSGFVGLEERSSGTATITGVGSVWNNDYDLSIGRDGSGTLNIENGGTVQAGRITRIARGSTGVGVINFSDGTLTTRGLWASSSQLLGMGTINTTYIVSDVDLVFNASTGLQTQTVMSHLPNQNIIINVDLSDQTNPGAMGVGYAGTGSLLIADGLVVSSISGDLGYYAGSSGTATIRGAESSWNIEEDLYVGRYGDGVLNIENRGMVNNPGAQIGEYEGSSGFVTVTGVGSFWNNTGELYVGRFGSGTIRVENGGGVSNNDDTYLGRYSNSSGSLTVTGTGSVWNNNLAKLFVGRLGTGTLNILDGGTVSSRYAWLASGEVAAIANVSGVDSAWDILDRLTIGSGGEGTLSISNGGSVHSGTVHIGQDVGSSGIATITGTDSFWDNTYTLTIGSGGTGTLIIEDDATVSIGNGMYIANNITANGTVNLAGGTLDLNGNDIIAGEGIAAFNFTGGTLRNTAAIDLDQPFVQQGGTLAPGGSIGQSDIIGGYDLTAGKVEIELGAPGNPHDLLTATGDIDIALTGTTLDLPAFGAMVAGTYTVIESTGGTLAGMFENITGLGIHPGLIDVNYTSNAVTVTLNWDYLPGDLNADGFVGIDDLNTILIAWNQNVTPGLLTSGDITGDGFIGIGDLTAVLGNWNTGTPPTNESFNAIPEPASLGLLSLGVMCGSGRRRSRLAVL